MDYRPKSEFGALSRDILMDLERLRPGLGELGQGDRLDQVADQVAARARLRLSELFQERYQIDPAEAGQLARYQREVEQILVPRYAALAHDYNRFTRGRALRGPDLFNRAAWGVLSLLVGAFVVWAPFIPIWEKWLPFALGAVAVLLSPALPDLHALIVGRRFKLQLLMLLADLDGAGEALPPPQLIGVLPGTDGPEKGES